MTNNYPNNCLKGVPKKEDIIGDSVVYTVFIPPSNNSANGWKESSINWELDAAAITELLNRKRTNNEYHFKGGAVRIPREEIDSIIEHFRVHDKFCYEIKEENNNKYHGNLLFIDSMDKSLRNTICGALSRAVSDLFKQNLDQKTQIESGLEI